MKLREIFTWKRNVISFLVALLIMSIFATVSDLVSALPSEGVQEVQSKGSVTQVIRSKSSGHCYELVVMQAGGSHTSSQIFKIDCPSYLTGK